jgi:hypothetical protein
MVRHPHMGLGGLAGCLACVGPALVLEGWRTRSFIAMLSVTELRCVRNGGPYMRSSSVASGARGAGGVCGSDWHDLRQGRCGAWVQGPVYR